MLWYERARYFNAAKFQYALQSTRCCRAFVYYDHNNGLWNQLDICFKCNLHLVGHFRRSRAREWQWALIFICFRKFVCKSVSRMLTVWLTIIRLFPWNKSSNGKSLKCKRQSQHRRLCWWCVCLRFYLTRQHSHYSTPNRIAVCTRISQLFLTWDSRSALERDSTHISLLHNVKMCVWCWRERVPHQLTWESNNQENRMRETKRNEWCRSWRR